MNIPSEAVKAACWPVGNATEAGTGLREILKVTTEALEGALPHILRAAAEEIDAEDRDVDYEEITEGAGRRHAADELRIIADRLERK